MSLSYSSVSHHSKKELLWKWCRHFLCASFTPGEFMVRSDEITVRKQDQCPEMMLFLERPYRLSVAFTSLCYDGCCLLTHMLEATARNMLLQQQSKYEGSRLIGPQVTICSKLEMGNHKLDVEHSLVMLERSANPCSLISD